METITATGLNGTVEFDGRMLTIKRDSKLARLHQGRGDKVIPLRQVGAVQLRPQSLMHRGHWQVSPVGEVGSSSSKVGDRRDPSNENAVIVSKKAHPEFEALNAAIQEAQAAL